MPTTAAGPFPPANSHNQPPAPTTNGPWAAYDPGVPRSIEYPRQPVPALLRAAARLYPRQAATIFQGARLSYAELDRLADACAAGLQAAGIRPGERVALVLPNLPQFPIAFFGALRAGAVVVGCNPLYTAHELAHQFADCGAETVIALDRFLPTVEQALALAAEPTRQPAAVRRIFVAEVAPFLPRALRLALRLKGRAETLRGRRLAGPPAAPARDRPLRAYTIGPFEALLRDFRDHPYEEVERRPEDLAVLQYTGGTTGQAKGAMLTHGNLMANTLQTYHWMPGTRMGSEVFLCVAPFFHIYGLTVGMNLAVYSGATMALLPRFKVEDVAKAIARYRPGIWPGVPTMYVALADLAERRGIDCSSLKVCISGAAPLPREVQERFERLTGGSLVEGYGLSEASPVTHCNPIYGKRMTGSIGLPYPDTEARIDARPATAADAQGVGPCGELLVRGPQVMRGYWNRPQETAAALTDGWLHTGDIARVDEEGYFYIVDRAKDLIIASGFNIYPREVEEVLYAHPAVREAAVIGIPDAYRGETVKAFIVLRDGVDDGRPAAGQVHPGTETDGDRLAEEITAFCRERLAAYKIPRQIEFRDQLPKSMIGKILRRALREGENSP